MPLVDGHELVVHLPNIPCKSIRLWGLLQNLLVALGNLEGLLLVGIVCAHLHSIGCDAYLNCLEDCNGINLVAFPSVVRGQG